MPFAPLVTAIDMISTGLAMLGVALLVLTLTIAGLSMYFAWFDTHIGPFLKRVLLSSLGGSFLIGGAGAIGIWAKGAFGLP